MCDVRKGTSTRLVHYRCNRTKERVCMVIMKNMFIYKKTVYCLFTETNSTVTCKVQNLNFFGSLRRVRKHMQIIFADTLFGLEFWQSNQLFTKPINMLLYACTNRQITALRIFVRTSFENLFPLLKTVICLGNKKVQVV